MSDIQSPKQKQSESSQQKIIDVITSHQELQ